MRDNYLAGIEISNFLRGNMIIDLSFVGSRCYF